MDILSSVSKKTLVMDGSSGLGKDMPLSLAIQGIDFILTYTGKMTKYKMWLIKSYH
jgi:hypothetical protein